MAKVWEVEQALTLPISWSLRRLAKGVLVKYRNMKGDASRPIKDPLVSLKKKFAGDLAEIKKLVSQLDPSAEVKEEAFYQAMLSGYMSQIRKKGKLVGMGWIFPRQTLLRKQAVIEDMIVEESQRGKGYGKKILLDLINWAKKQGVEVIELITNPQRKIANQLYQEVGFKLHRTNHYLLRLKTGS